MPTRRERFEGISRGARESTNKDMAGEISALTSSFSFSEEDIQRLFPRKIDKERFADLMAIVAAGTDDNTKVTSLRENLDRVGVVLVRVLKLLL